MIRVLSMPGRNHGNPYFPMFCDSLENVDVRVINIRDREAKLLRFDVLHLHFPTHFLTQTKTLRAMLWSFVLLSFFTVAKLLGKRIVYSVHDPVPINLHREWLVWPYLAAVHWLCDGYVFLNETSQTAFYTRFPKQRTKRFTTIPLWPYQVQMLSPDLRSSRRLDLVGHTDALVVGLLGNIKRYKGLELLLNLPSRLSTGRRITTVIAGRIENTYTQDATAIIDSLNADSVIRIDKALSDRDLNELIQCVDVVLLPYLTGWNSSAAMLVLSNRGRILASKRAMFIELQEAVGKPWIHCCDFESKDVNFSLLETLAEVDDLSISQADIDRLTLFLDNCNIGSAALKVRAFYEELLPIRREIAAV